MLFVKDEEDCGGIITITSQVGSHDVCATQMCSNISHTAYILDGTLWPLTKTLYRKDKRHDWSKWDRCGKLEGAFSNEDEK